jgi:tryptophan-rich sensory protein
VAFGEIVVLWLAILATLVAFWRVRALAGVLFVPYLVWVTIAGSLNYVLWQLNP